MMHGVIMNKYEELSLNRENFTFTQPYCHPMSTEYEPIWGLFWTLDNHGIEKLIEPSGTKVMILASYVID